MNRGASGNPNESGTGTGHNMNGNGVSWGGLHIYADGVTIGPNGTLIAPHNLHLYGTFNNTGTFIGSTDGTAGISNNPPVTFNGRGANIIGGDTLTGLDIDLDPTLVFDGSTHRVDIPADSSLEMTTDLTISAWVWFDAIGGAQIIFEGGNHELQLAATGSEIRLYLNDATEYEVAVTSGLNLTAGQWYHIAATCSNNTAKIFINGVEEASDTYTGTISMAGSTYTIGAETPAAGSGQNLEGRIADVQVYSRALTVTDFNGVAYSEIVWNMQHYNPADTTGLEGRWLLNEDSGAVADNLGACGATCDGAINTPMSRLFDESTVIIRGSLTTSKDVGVTVG